MHKNLLKRGKNHIINNGVAHCVVYGNNPPVNPRNPNATYHEFYVPFDNALDPASYKGKNRVIVEYLNGAVTGNWWYTNSHYDYFTGIQTNFNNVYAPGQKYPTIMY